MTYFRKVVDAGNITAAAEMLNLAQPALGAQIRQLEEELGVELLVRHSRGITPTAAGKLLHRHAQRILDDLDQVAKEVRSLETTKQDQVRLGVSPSMVLMLGPDLLIDAQRSIPNVTISILEERTLVLLDALEHGQVDIAFLNNVEDRPGLERKAVLEEDLLLVTAPTQEACQDAISFSQALRHDLAIGGERGVLRRIVETEAQRLSLKLRVAYEVHSVSSMKAMVARGTAAMIMPYSLVADEMAEGTLSGRRIVRPALTRTLYVVRQRARAPIVDDQRVAAHIDALMDAYLNMVSPWARSLV